MRLINWLVTILFCFILQAIAAQPYSAKGKPSLPSDIGKPSTLPLHPLGIFFYRPSHNLRTEPISNAEFSLHYDSGNVWGQEVDVFVPNNASLRKDMASLPFYERIFYFDEDLETNDRYMLGYDGVLKQLKLAGRLAIGEHSETHFALRGAVLTKGRIPFSLLTSDRFIEWFHTSVVGGEDPFARKVMGMDKVALFYHDRNGSAINLDSGNFFVSGLETAFFRHFNLGLKHDLNGNVGLHFGYNTSSYNHSFDFGLSAAIMSDVLLTEERFLRFGQSLNCVRKSILSLDPHQTDFGTNTFMASAESSVIYVKMRPDNRFWSLGISFNIQTPYNEREEKNYYVPYNEIRLARWHDAASHLYNYLNVWSLHYAFGSRLVYTIYLTQDFSVNNAPDLQTGIKVGVPL